MSTLPVINQSLAQLNDIILGKSTAIKLALSCLLARGHLLIEDLPGMGKTTLSHALAATLGLSYQRIQFTSDLLPSDLLGVNVFDKNAGKFEFHSGPIFSQLLLADEINRASPKTQSALLEAMEEGQVSIEGETRPLPKPFFVIATQNPSEQIGTFALPESQLDRFMMRISLGYPDAQAEKQLLAGNNRRELIEHLKPLLQSETLLKVQTLVAQVKASPSIVDYVYNLVSVSRTQSDALHHGNGHGLSPRAAMALMQAARAWAFIEGRTHLLPDDIQAVFKHVCEHRVNPQSSSFVHPVSEAILTSIDIF